MEQPITEDTFREMCRKHDLTYTYSDDGRCYEAGRREYILIEAAAKQLPRDVAVRIWNEVVETKLKPEACDMFKW